LAEFNEPITFIKSSIKMEHKKYVRRGDKVDQTTVYKKGSCANCGSASHQSRDCLEKPKARGAKQLNTTLVHQIDNQPKIDSNSSLSYEHKRDRWSNYDPNSFSETAKLFSEEEIEKRKQKAIELEKKQVLEPETEAKRFPTKGKTENLTNIQGDQTIHPSDRSRVDTAKYLVDLETNEKEYDPKTRVLRASSSDTSDVPSTETLMQSGEYLKFQEIQQFAWEQAQHGNEVALEGTPSQTEQMYREFKEKMENARLEKERMLKAKYNVEETRSIPKEMILVESERYVEYDRYGQPIKRKLELTQDLESESLVKKKKEEESEEL
jgi:pre-mRNA-processing factor SLU7